MLKVARGKGHLPSRHLYIYLSTTYAPFTDKPKRCRIEEL